jgi:MFS family permease
MQEEGEFDWDVTTQSTILASLNWCYILSQVIGGILTQHFGTKIVFGLSQLITAICSLLIPSAAPLHYGAVIALRSVQGVASVSYGTNVSCSSLYNKC